MRQLSRAAPAAHWLMLTLRDGIAQPNPLATAEFTSLRMHLLKIAGRTATRVRLFAVKR
jgi:hypothetical protein